MPKGRPLAKREYELVLLLSLEQGLGRLLKTYARPGMWWPKSKEALAEVRRERQILEAAMSGDEDAKRLRNARPNDDSVGT